MAGRGQKCYWTSISVIEDRLLCVVSLAAAHSRKRCNIGYKTSLLCNKAAVSTTPLTVILTRKEQTILAAVTSVDGLYIRSLRTTILSTPYSRTSSLSVHSADSVITLHGSRRRQQLIIMPEGFKKWWKDVRQKVGTGMIAVAAEERLRIPSPTEEERRATKQDFRRDAAALLQTVTDSFGRQSKSGSRRSDRPLRRTSSRGEGQHERRRSYDEEERPYGRRSTDGRRSSHGATKPQEDRRHTSSRPREYTDHYAQGSEHEERHAPSSTQAHARTDREGRRYDPKGPWDRRRYNDEGYEIRRR